MSSRHRGQPHLKRSKRPLLAAAIVAAALTGSPSAYAQGCALCRDNTATTTPATQRAFRHSIEFLGTAAAAFFGATLLVVRRYR